MKVEVAVFWYKQVLMGNKESSLPGLIYKRILSIRIFCIFVLALLQDKYPYSRVIVDVTEIFVEQPAVTELQQLTFSKYKNHNTFKYLIGISPSGAVTFISDLYPGCISDKELIKKI